MSRWVRIHAGIFDHHLFQGHAMSEREAWLWLIVNAAWKDTKHRIGASIVDVPMGSLFVTLRQLQAHWGWKSDYRVRAFLRVLENERMITTKTNAGKTQVSVCNYSKYQAAFREDNAEKTHGQRTENAIKTPIHHYTIEDTPYVVSSSAHEMASNEDGEAVSPKPSKAKSAGTRIDPNWQPTTAEIAAAENIGLTPDEIRNEAEKFRDYWVAKSGQAARKADWSATWRNWARTARDRRPQSAYRQPIPKPKSATVAHHDEVKQAIERRKNEQRQSDTRTLDLDADAWTVVG